MTRFLTIIFLVAFSCIFASDDEDSNDIDGGSHHRGKRPKYTKWTEEMEDELKLLSDSVSVKSDIFGKCNKIAEEINKKFNSEVGFVEVTGIRCYHKCRSLEIKLATDSSDSDDEEIKKRRPRKKRPRTEEPEIMPKGTRSRPAKAPDSSSAATAPDKKAEAQPEPLAASPTAHDFGELDSNLNSSMPSLLAIQPAPQTLFSAQPTSLATSPIAHNFGESDSNLDSSIPLSPNTAKPDVFNAELDVIFPQYPPLDSPFSSTHYPSFPDSPRAMYNTISPRNFVLAESPSPYPVE